MNAWTTAGSQHPNLVHELLHAQTRRNLGQTRGALEVKDEDVLGLFLTVKDIIGLDMFGCKKVSGHLNANLYIVYILQIEKEDSRFGLPSLTWRYEAMLET